MNEKKPIHVKPSMYAYWYEDLKKIALRYGYNLVLHGSLARDFDLIAIPWANRVRPHEQMIVQFAKRIGGEVMKRITKGPLGHPNYAGRIGYIINIRRGEVILQPKTKEKKWVDAQFYLDISITPRPNEGYKKYCVVEKRFNDLNKQNDKLRAELKELKYEKDLKNA